MLLETWAINDGNILLITFYLAQTRACWVFSEQKLHVRLQLLLLMRYKFVKVWMFGILFMFKACSWTRVSLLEALVTRFLRCPWFAFSAFRPLFVLAAVPDKVFFMPSSCWSIRGHCRVICLQDGYLWIVLNHLVLQYALIPITYIPIHHFILRSSPTQVLFAFGATAEVFGFNFFQDSDSVHQKFVFSLWNLEPSLSFLFSSPEYSYFF